MKKRVILKSYKLFLLSKTLVKSFTFSDIAWMILALLLVTYKLWMPSNEPQRNPGNLIIYDFVEPGATLPIHDALKEYRE